MVNNIKKNDFDSGDFTGALPLPTALFLIIQSSAQNVIMHITL
jgi:hypothetical protein